MTDSLQRTSPETESDWQDDPGADERWNAGCTFAMLQLCHSLGVDPQSISWDAATETLDGDVHAVIGNILEAKYGEDFDPRGLAQRPDLWRPIETAPTDGTEIIGLYYREWDYDTKPSIYGPWTVAFKGKKWRSSWDGQEVISSESDFGTEYKEPDIDPTHWQPMPTPPASPHSSTVGHSK